ncbi:MAG: response regulator transcription factor [Prevotella sp.]|nr:response regulator transcription factor [Prevotella sp.]
MPLTDDVYRILALDDHPVVLEGLTHLLSSLPDTTCQGFTNIGTLTDTLYSNGEYDLLILDLELPNADGFEVIKDVRKRLGQIAILIYTMHEEPWLLAKLARLDIQGVVSKNRPTSDLVDAVNTIRQGGTSFSEAFLEQLKQVQTKNDVLKSSPPFTLPEGEMKVLQCLSKGMNTKEIAEALYLSENTVGTYRHRLMVRFGVHNVVQLLAAARKYLEDRQTI